MSGSSAKLFGDLSDTLFRPLAGRNRHVYAEVLYDLHKLMGDDGGDDDVSRDAVKSTIADTLRRLEVASLEVDEDAYEEEEQADDLPTRIYARLRTCGWLIDEREGYSYVCVMPFVAADLLAALCRIQDRQHERYGVRVFSVFNQLRTAANLQEPHAGAALAGAAREAGEFGRHLRQMANDVRSVVELVAGLKDARDILRAFFERFVDDFLVKDYTQLKTAQNPFRYHADVNSMAAMISYSPELRTHIAKSLLAMDGRPDDALPEALLEVDRFLNQITRAFSKINDRLAKIDGNRNRLEAKTRNLVLYSASGTPGAAGRIDDLLKRLMQVPLKELERLDIGSVVPVSTGYAISEFTLAQPKAKRKPVTPQKFRTSKRDMTAILRRRELIAEYMQKIKPDPEVVKAYLQRLTLESDAVLAEEIQISSAEDLILFLTTGSLNKNGKVDKRTLRGYAIEPLPGRIETEWYSVPNFRLVKTGN
jgi:hypothetical protein